MANYLITYKPLCVNKKGEEICTKYNIDKYVDHSFRREPSFESKFPGISSICRGKNFAPRLQIGDRIIYLTVKGKYEDSKIGHWRIVSILEVIHRFESHDDAVKWYKENNIDIPTNCITDETKSKWDEHSIIEENKREPVDKLFIERVTKYPQYLICGTIYLNIATPKPIFEQDMVNILGKVYNTQSPVKITHNQYSNFIKFINKM